MSRINEISKLVGVDIPRDGGAAVNIEKSLLPAPALSLILR